MFIPNPQIFYYKIKLLLIVNFKLIFEYKKKQTILREYENEDQGSGHNDTK
jgi:hypothetical protein